MTLRSYFFATRFKTFKCNGTLEDVITQLMCQSRAVTADGMMVGGFVMKGDVPSDKKLTIDVADKNALELINEICRLTSTTWTLGPYSFIIEVEKPEPTKANGR